MSAPVGRFAPSPTGRMHAGNIYAALACWLLVKSQGGSIVLRIEDLDRERSKPEHIDDVQRDFESLGLFWDKGPYFQSTRDNVYEEAFQALSQTHSVYPCFCTRASLHAASAPHRGEKFVYPGTCRSLTADERAERATEKAPAWRVEVPDSKISFTDLIQGPYKQNLATDCGDFVIKRSDGAFAYQLAVVVDDAEQGITHVVRGMDLLCSTPQQMFLQQALGYKTPEYAHIPLMVAERDRRLSKRDKDASLEQLLQRFKTPEAIIGHIAGISGLAKTTEPARPEELLDSFSLDAYKARIADPVQVQWR